MRHTIVPCDHVVAFVLGVVVVVIGAIIESSLSCSRHRCRSRFAATGAAALWMGSHSGHPCTMRWHKPRCGRWCVRLTFAPPGTCSGGGTIGGVL